MTRPIPTSARVPMTPPAQTGSDDFEDFIYLLSHDVRNSVRALLEMPQWIEDDLRSAGHPISGPLADDLRLMNTHTRRLDRMLADLLVHSRVGRKQSVDSICLTTALESVLGEMVVPTGITILRDFAVPVLTIGDRDILTLLHSLVSNAIRHHDRSEGQVEVSTWAEAGKCVLRVRDDGPGIAEKYRARVFEAMTTLRPRDEVEGSGMGLTIARKIATRYGADMQLMGGGGRGTCVEVRFPIE